MIKRITFLKDFHPFNTGESFDLKPITILTGDQGAGKSTLLDLLVKYEKPKLAEVNPRYNVQNGKVVSTGKRGSWVNDQTKETEPIIAVDPESDFKLCYVDTEKHNPRMTHGETTLEYKDAMVEVLRDEALHKIIQTMDGYKNIGYTVLSDIKTGKAMKIDDITNRLLENTGLYFDSKRGGSILGDEIKVDVATVAAATMQSHGQSIFPLIQKSTENASGMVVMLDEPETALSIRSQHKIARIILDLAHRNQVIIATHSPIIMDICDTVLSLEHRRWMSTEEFLNSQKTNN